MNMNYKNLRLVPKKIIKTVDSEAPPWVSTSCGVRKKLLNGDDRDPTKPENAYCHLPSVQKAYITKRYSEIDTAIDISFRFNSAV